MNISEIQGAVLEFIKQFTVQQVTVAKWVVIGLIMILTIYAGMISTKKTKETLFSVAKKGSESFRNSKIFKYGDKEAYLRRLGAEYMLGKEFHVNQYFLIKFVGAILGLAVALKFNVLLFPVGLAVGYYILDFLMVQSNKSDNDKMMLDIKKIYDTLRIQTKAGVFLTAALGECYLVVKEQRLKDGLQELTGYINAKGDIDEGLESFKSRFKSNLIDNFCVVIKQSTQSGKTVEVLSDLADQISDLDEAINVRLEGKVQLKQNLIQFSVFGTAVAVITYGLVVNMMGQVQNF